MKNALCKINMVFINLDLHCVLMERPSKVKQARPTDWIADWIMDRITEEKKF